MSKLQAKLRPVTQISNVLGETPLWAEDEGALYWINCEHPPEILRWEAATDTVRRWPMPERVGGLVLKVGGGALITLASGLFDFNFETSMLSLRVPSPLEEIIALHECACDPTGRLWVGAIDRRVGPSNLHPGGAKLFRLDGDELVPVMEDISCANGLAFSPDGRTLYVSDSPSGRCERFDLDPTTGSLSNRRTFFELAPGEGFVDGAAVDVEGGYWAALVYAGLLRRYLPNGDIDREYQLPFENPTKPAFGGAELATLFLTSTSEGISDAPLSPLNGGLFAFEPGEHGLPENRLRA